jgi:zinc protease
VLEDASNRVVFAGHPYAIDPQGTADTIAKIKAADLAAYHKKVMTTSQLLLVIVGDVEPAAVQKRVAASFASVPRGSYKDEHLAAFSFAKPSLDVNQKPVQTDYVKGTFTAPSISSPDYYAMRTAISILQQAVFQEVRGRRNLSYAPDASMDERAANTGSISVSSTNPNEAVAVMLEEIRKLQRDPVDEDTIGQMAGFFLTTYYMKQETNAAQAAELAQYELLGGGWRNSLEFLERMRRVKPADIQAVANKYMKNLQFVIVGNAKGVDRNVYLQAF